MSHFDWDAHERSGEPIGSDVFVKRGYLLPDGTERYYPMEGRPPEGSRMVGIIESHHPAGPVEPTDSHNEFVISTGWCSAHLGFVNTPGRDGQPTGAHTLVSEHPLTITASVLCPVCGHHGFITAGCWIGC